MNGFLKKHRYGVCRFTLIELAATILVMLVLLGISTVAFRSASSDSKGLEKNADAFREFCSKVRVNAAEAGEPRVVCYNASERKLLAYSPYVDTDEATDRDSEDVLRAREERRVIRARLDKIYLAIPEGTDLAAGSGLENRPDEIDDADVSALDGADAKDDSENDFGGAEELFRIFPDGRVSGLRDIVFQRNSSTLKLHISRITGQILEIKQNN